MSNSQTSNCSQHAESQPSPITLAAQLPCYPGRARSLLGISPLIDRGSVRGSVVVRPRIRSGGSYRPCSHLNPTSRRLEHVTCPYSIWCITWAWSLEVSQFDNIGFSSLHPFVAAGVPVGGATLSTSTGSYVFEFGRL